MSHIHTLKTPSTASNESMNNTPAPSKPLPVRRLLWMAAALGTVLLLAGIAGFAYIWFSGGSGQAGSAITAPSLTRGPDDTRTLFHLTQDESEVRFIIQETLLGNPKTVIGTTHQVAGDILVDFEQPLNTQVGAFRINVRTLATDNEIRNRALRGQILQSEQDRFEYAEFVPTRLIGLPAQITPGQPVEFQMVGNLTVHGITREVTFDVQLISVSDSRLEGTASTTVKHSDFGISIPDAPGVAGVSDDVRLEIDIAALPDDAA